MESMSVLERLSELLPALPPGLIEAWGQLVLFAVPVCLYLAAVVLPFCGALRTDPRPFRQEEPAGALFPPAGAVRQFSELAFPCVLRGPRAVQGRPLRDIPPAVSGGPVPFGGPSAWRHHHLDRRGGGVEAAARLARAARFPRVSDRKQPRLPPHHRGLFWAAWPCRARSCRKRTTFRR